MLYSTCPTCGYFLGQKIIEWEKGDEMICSNPKLSNEEKSKQKQELLMNLKIRRYCCRMRIMSYKDIVKDIQPVK
jgi:DNA-directed RNA polymerase subunit N (RpoN/RPB10)